MSNTEKTVTVNLLDMSGIGLIIPYASGVLYENQAGGYACLHPSIEGFFIPFGNNIDYYAIEDKSAGEHLANEMLSYFSNPPWGGHCYSGLTAEDADYLDNLFHKYEFTKAVDLKVDRTKLGSSVEAWIYVTLDSSKQDIYLKGLEVKNAVLTCPNSD